MNKDKDIVRIFGLPIAGCKPGKSWQDAAEFAKDYLVLKFGNQVEVEYIELLPSRWKDFPEIIELINKGKAKIPIIFVNSEVISTADKINVSQIEKHLLNMGVKNI